MSNAKNDALWHNKKCAVSLTYDDALNVHLDNVAPQLASRGLRGTFYILASYAPFGERSDAWKAVASQGNELGNHTLFHPCEGKAPGREWVNPNYDLNNYTPQRMLDEIRMANTLLNVIDGKTKRTFAYPCGDMLAGSTSYVQGLKSEFIAARGVEGKMQKVDEIDLYNIGSFMIMDQSGAELIQLAQRAMEENVLLVYLFHGVGGEHNINVSLEAHAELLDFLKQNEASIWVAPLLEVAEHVKAYTAPHG